MEEFPKDKTKSTDSGGEVANANCIKEVRTTYACEVASQSRKFSKRFIIEVVAVIGIVVVIIGLSLLIFFTTKHKHAYKTYYNLLYHWQECSVDGCDQKTINTTKHTYSNGKCSCGKVHTEHEYTITKYDDNYHWEECSVVGCTSKQSAKTAHEYNSGTTCSCGKTHIHYYIQSASDAKYHWEECRITGCTSIKNKTAHTFNNGTCSCGKIHIEHEYTKTAYDTTYHWKECTVTGCGKKVAAMAEHVYSSDGVCSCGKTHPHEYVVKYDDYYHWEDCKLANCPNKNIRKTTHSISSGKCLCGYEIGNTTDFSRGFGSADRPFIITNSTHFKNISKYTSAGKYFKIGANFEIDISTLDEVAAIKNGGFSALSKFDGILDGSDGSVDGSYTITLKGVRMDDYSTLKSDQQYGALINNNSGTIKKLTIKYAQVQLQSNKYLTNHETGEKFNFHTKAYYHSGTFTVVMGGVVGYNSGTIDNVIVDGGEFECNRNNSVFGVICGLNDGGKILNCTAKNIKIYAMGDSGGIVGVIKNSGTVDNCKLVNGTIIAWAANDNGKTTCRSWGGIVGFARTGSKIVWCYVDSVKFYYKGENSIYHKSTCIADICVGFICGALEKPASTVFSDCKVYNSKPEMLFHAESDATFRTKTHSTKYRFAYSNYQIGRYL